MLMWTEPITNRKIALFEFDLRRALAGERVITRSGNLCSVLLHVPEAADPYERLVVLGSEQDVLLYREDGRFSALAPESSLDLFMAAPSAAELRMVVAA